MQANRCLVCAHIGAQLIYSLSQLYPANEHDLAEAKGWLTDLFDEDTFEKVRWLLVLDLY